MEHCARVLMPVIVTAALVLAGCGAGSEGAATVDPQLCRIAEEELVPAFSFGSDPDAGWEDAEPLDETETIARARTALVAATSVADGSPLAALERGIDAIDDYQAGLPVTYDTGPLQEGLSRVCPELEWRGVFGLLGSPVRPPGR